MNLNFNLQFFAEGGEGTGGANAGMATASTGTESSTSTGATEVIYGKQPEDETEVKSIPDAGEDVNAASQETTAGEAGEASWEDIKKNYKEDYSRDVQNIINRRFKEAKDKEREYQQYRDGAGRILSKLSQRYGLEAGDFEALDNAIENDEALWEDLAEAAGLTTEQYRENQRLVAENNRYRAMNEYAQKQQEYNQQIQTWNAQAEETRQTYEGFDFEAELMNREFCDLIQNGIPVKTAYEVIHMNDLISGAANVAAKQAEQRTVNNIKSRSSRPSESGTSTNSVVYKNDVSKLTKKDRAEIVRRAARGEKISF